MKIIKAEYGFFGSIGSECADVTAIVKKLVKTGNRRIRASNELGGGDPAPNEVKELRVEYLTGGEHKTQTIAENQILELPAGTDVIHAIYGLVGDEATPNASQIMDLTAKLNSLVKDGTLVARADNKLAGRDPASMIPKELRVEYSCHGTRKFVRVGENQTLALPDEGERAVLPNTYNLAVAPDGRTEGLLWQPGTIVLTTAAGRTLTATARAVPEPVEIAGPWELTFPPNWGAPEKITLAKLISWTEHPDAGVKYFSGTATYRKVFNYTPASGQQPSKIFLNLGQLKNIAEVKLNGQDLGILWKPPFRVEVTAMLRTGKNALEVRITNLWPNRLIGDEQLPDDREWNGLQLKAWPQWVLDGKPSPTGRFTFTTWHHWTKDDEPLPSGLFGPVLLRTALEVPVQP